MWVEADPSEKHSATIGVEAEGPHLKKCVIPS